MKPIVVLLLLAALAAGAWFLLGEGGEKPAVQTDDPAGGTPVKSTKESGSAGTLTGVSADTSLEQPEMAKLKTPAAILLLGHNNTQWTGKLLQTFKSMDDLKYASWFYELTPTGEAKGAGPGPGDFRGLPGLEERPTAEYLEEHDVRALFLDTVNPNVFTRAFWETVAERVRSGRMGLYVRPNYPKAVDRNDKAPAVHGVLTHPILSELLPVKKAKELRGSPLPGVYGTTEQQLRVTDAGIAHPATRLVANPEASRNIWNGAQSGEEPIGTIFVYPVELPSSGPQVLVDLENNDYPAVIVSPDGGARVLWMGNAWFGKRTFFNAEKDKFQGMQITHWLLWLVGQADE